MSDPYVTSQKVMAAPSGSVGSYAASIHATCARYFNTILENSIEVLDAMPQAGRGSVGVYAADEGSGSWKLTSSI